MEVIYMTEYELKYWLGDDEDNGADDENGADDSDDSEAPSESD